MDRIAFFKRRLRDFWQAAFSTHDRINTSTPFARQMNLQDQVRAFPR